MVPSIMPLKLKALGYPNWRLGMIMTTVPGILNIGITPYLSFKSDRYRSKWGRRLPFIIWTLPDERQHVLALKEVPGGTLEGRVFWAQQDWNPLFII